MGLLDEAIREHLDLKRRRGADASEVSRQEQEALGPARRGPEPLEVPPDPEAELDGLEEAQADATAHEPEHVEAEPDAHAEPLEHEYHAPETPPAEMAHEPQTEVAAAPLPADTHDPHAPAEPPIGGETMAFDVAADIAQEDAQFTHEEPAHAQEPAPAQAPEAPSEHEHPEEPAHEPAEETSPAPAPAAEEAEPEPHPDDVLEETPEFLQETPEHDRLWFEQRPPKDFDFDK